MSLHLLYQSHCNFLRKDRREIGYVNVAGHCQIEKCEFKRLLSLSSLFLIMYYGTDELYFLLIQLSLYTNSFGILVNCSCSAMNRKEKQAILILSLYVMRCSKLHSARAAIFFEVFMCLSQQISIFDGMLQLLDQAVYCTTKF